MIIIESVISALFVISSMFIGIRMLISIQLNGYRVSKTAYLQPKSLKQLIEFLLLLLSASVALITTRLNYIINSATTMFILTAHIIYYCRSYLNLRTKFKFTNRAIRLYVLYVCILAIMHSATCMLHFELIISRLISISLLILSNPIVILVNLIIAPFEFLNNTRYIKRAKLKLNKINAIKIGITGSYGKTSCKNILTAMLSTKYKVLKTDKSRNTPMGIYLTTNELTGDEEVFIAEMGARRCGDIKKLCDIVNPQYGIITGIGNQHLGEFGSLGKIIKAKCELIDMMPPNGFMVFNGDDKKTKSLKTRFHGESQTVSINSEEGIYAKNIKLSTNGLSFDIFGFETTISVSTKLLGRHNVLNILMCTVLAHKLGIGLEEIKSAISNLNPTHHRLELLKNTGEITIIDDSYNANIDGSLFALEVLKLFKGRKIVFSQGIIELGIINKRVNQELGMMIAKSADLIILTGPNSSALLKGIDSAGFSGKILKFGDFKETTKALKSILKPGDVLLVQNDIP